MESFEFVAPQYVENMEENFGDTASKNLDSYFYAGNDNKTSYSTPKSKNSNEELYLTPCEVPGIEEKQNIVEERISMEKLSSQTTVGTLKQTVMENISKRQDIINRKRKMFTSEEKGCPPKKYVSLAEAAYYFQYSTPPRFRLHSKPDTDIGGEKLVPEPRIIILKRRNKETQSEIKFNSGNNNPNNEVPQKMPRIRPLSRSLKKEVKEKNDKEFAFTFKARPVPRSLFPNRPVRVAVDEVNSPSNIYKNFFERGEALLERREASVRKILEEEQMARGSFLATPLPSFVDVKNSTMVSEISSICPEDSICSSAFHSTCFSSTMNESFKFKARDARVLRRQPFFPKKNDRALLEINNIELNTKKRARERAEFNKVLKEKEELKAQRMKEDEEAKKQALAQEIAVTRKILVHTPYPLPSFYKNKN